MLLMANVGNGSLVPEYEYVANYSLSHMPAMRSFTLLVAVSWLARMTTTFGIYKDNKKGVLLPRLVDLQSMSCVWE